MSIFLLVSPSIDAFWVEVLEPMLASPAITIVGAYVERTTTTWFQRVRFHLRRGRGGYVLVMVLKNVFRRARGDALSSTDYLRSRGIDVQEVSDLYTPETLAHIRAQNPDCIFRNGFGLIREPVLSIAPRGVISYHHGDIRRYRGQPVGFWELYHGEPEMGVTVQVLSEKLDAGEIVVERRIPVKTTDSWGSLERRAYGASADLVHEACRLLADPSFRPTHVPEDELGKLYTIPNLRQWLGFQRRVAARRLRALWSAPGEASAEPDQSARP